MLLKQLGIIKILSNNNSHSFMYEFIDEEIDFRLCVEKTIIEHNIINLGINQNEDLVSLKMDGFIIVIVKDELMYLIDENTDIESFLDTQVTEGLMSEYFSNEVLEEFKTKLLSLHEELVIESFED